MIRNCLILLLTWSLNAISEEKIALAPDSWNRADAIQFAQYLGRDSAILSGGAYTAKNSKMYNGRIDFDIAMHGHRGFVGVVFRHQSDTDYELIYLRPHKSGLPDALQYTPVLNGMSAWQLYSNEGFTAPANLAHNRWVHVAVVINGDQAEVFIDDRPEPALVIDDLKGDFSAGAVGIWGRNVAHFANFSYTSSEVATKQSTRTKFMYPPNTLTDWQISDVFERTLQADTVVPSTTAWQRVEVETGGLLNFSRYRSKLANEERKDSDSTKDLIFAKTTISSTNAGYRRLKFGYSDEVTILLNGQPLYTGKSGFSQRYPSSLGIVGLESDAVYLPLTKGDNELVFAVSEVFGGWGLTAVLD